MAASTLAAAALFSPLRRRMQALVDRRFNRSRFNAQRVVEDFSRRLRDQHDLNDLGGELETVAHHRATLHHLGLAQGGSPMT